MKGRPGRPSTTPDIAALVVRMANENTTWGYARIRGGLKSLGHDVARNTIKAILKDHGIEPAPERRTKTPWKTFLAAHWDGLAAADFFTVEVLTIVFGRCSQVVPKFFLHRPAFRVGPLPTGAAVHRWQEGGYRRA